MEYFFGRITVMNCDRAVYLQKSKVVTMSIIAFLLASMIVLVRVYVPISSTFMGGWTVRATIFILWIIAVLSSGGISRNQFLSKLHTRWIEIVCYVLWIGLLFLYYYMQNGEDLLTEFMFYGYVGTIPFYFLGSYYSVDQNKGRLMAVAISVVVGISSLMAIPVVWHDPSLVRMGAIISTNATRSLGIGSYSDLTGFAIVLPLFVTASFQSKHVVCLLGVAACIATIALLMIATLSGIILLTGMAIAGCIVYYLVLSGLRFHHVFIGLAVLTVVVLAAIYIFPSVYEKGGIGRFYDKLANTFVSLAGIISGEERDPTSRFVLMMDSFRVFLDNPIFGAGLNAGEKGLRGGHSSWIDALGLYGLVGCAPYFLFHFLIFRRLWKTWRANRENAMYWGCLLTCALYIFYGFFNVTSQATTVALFLYVTAAGGQANRSPKKTPVATLANPKKRGQPNKNLTKKSNNFGLPHNRKS